MAVTRATKEAQLEALTQAFSGVETAILVDYKGLNVPQVTELRRQLRAVKAQYKVVKNTLAKRALSGHDVRAARPSTSRARRRWPTRPTTRWRWPRR